MGLYRFIISSTRTLKKTEHPLMARLCQKASSDRIGLEIIDTPAMINAIRA